MGIKLQLRFLVLLLLFPTLLLANHQFKTLQIEGNKVLDKKHIYHSLGLEIPTWYEFWKDKRPEINPKIKHSLYESAIGLYRSEGFYHAKVTEKETNNTITFSIEEGPIVRVNAIDIQSKFKIKDLITFKKGDRFIASQFVDIKKNIKSRMLKLGYCNFNLNAKAYVDIEKNLTDLRYQLQENEPCKFGNITIHAPKDIPEKVVYSRLLYFEGDQYSSEKVNKSYSTISGLEAFDGVQINMHKDHSTLDSEIMVNSKEKTTRREVGIGYETNYGPKAFLHWSRRNFLGGARKLSFDLKYSKKERYIKNQFFWPALIKIPKMGYYLDFKNEFSYSRLTYNNFQETKYANKIHLLKDYDWFSIDTGLGLEKITITKFEDVCNISEGHFLMFYPFGQVIFDLRDSKINPKNGIYLAQYLEAGLEYILSESSYLTSLTEARAILTENRFTFAAKGKLGFINEFAGSLPESKLFYAGGAFSNRGYSYNSLGSFDTTCGQVGAKTLIDTSLEVSHPLYHNFDIAFFLDSTLMSVKTLEFSLDFKNSVGAGIRYNTVIGPIKFDIGMDIKDSSQYAIHFQIGQSF